MNTPFTLVYYLIFIILLYTDFCYRCTFAPAGRRAADAGKLKNELYELK